MKLRRPQRIVARRLRDAVIVGTLSAAVGACGGSPPLDAASAPHRGEPTALSAPAPAASHADGARADALRARIAPIVEPVLAAAPMNGVGVVLVEPAGTIVVGFGRRGDHDARAPDGASTFEIGSVAKVMAGVLLADAARRGEVALDAPVRAYLPGDIPLPAVRGREMTLRDLATHRSGLPYMPTNFVELDPVTHRTRYGLDELRAFLRDFALPAAPGERYEYSNLGIALVALALGERTGMPWGTFLERRLFEPLGMHRSAYVDHDNARADDDALDGHDDDGRLMPPRVDASPIGPCCAVRSTMDDMAAFMRAALDPTAALAPAFAAAAEVTAPAHPGEGDATSLAWLVRSREALLVKDGQVAGYRTLLALLPRERRGIFVVVNSQEIDIETLGGALVDDVLAPTAAIDRAPHAELVVAAMPADATAADVSFGDAIRLEGWEAPASVRRGATAHVVLYFRALTAGLRDWRVFVHGDAATDGVERLHADHFPGADQDSTCFWQPGELVRDDVAIAIPARYGARSFDVWLGLYRGNVRMHPTSARAETEHDRVRGPTVRVAR